MRAFIFSLDAFVAFTLSLVAVYSLVFFSSVPSGYYATLLQAHTLASDTLEALGTTPCTPAVAGCPGDQGNVSILEYLVMRESTPDTIRSFLDPLIPPAFGYRLESKQNDGGWSTLYDSNSDSTRLNGAQKLSVSSSRILFQYSGTLVPPSNPYTYITCQGGAFACSVPENTYLVPDARVVLTKLTIYV